MLFVTILLVLKAIWLVIKCFSKVLKTGHFIGDEKDEH